ncbi:anaerobic sulfatase maturase [Cetobacterium somerae]|uniref:anaerobic sulfatase maturase n=1 Tax=Cetobacterium sp. NK01 TaxID=2993530 RepID=UPI002117134E|nr:anaerobic sulfatase maturase [Cetobacterium sp. NK01]MCQ8211346.1 anaerobic sulfatase maturase [Cetobacterium sp. NK01]
MNHINLLIKPSSSLCNINCEYCFYSDVASNRSHHSFGFMTLETLEKLVKESFLTAKSSITFSFQGGEPTLIGIEFYKKFHNFIKKYNVNNISVSFAMQTNGILLNKEWINLFKKENYLLGISLDGHKDIHNFFRRDKIGKGTFAETFKNIKLLQKNNINFNILCVVNKKTVENIKEIYTFFKNSKFKYLQFIPCLDKLDNSTGDYSLTEKEYGFFLDELFSFWYTDLKNKKYTSIRFFDNLLSVILNNQAESCDMNGHCSINTVVESNGNIYPCDFYVLDELLLGNIHNISLKEILTCDKALNFVRSSIKIDENCKHCNYFNLCKSGCRRHKNFQDGTFKNRFCNSFKYFYSKNINKLLEISRSF